MTRWRPAALAALAVVLGACSGESKGLGPPTTLHPTTPTGVTDGAGLDDFAGIEAKLVEEQRKRFPGLTVGAASCPDGVPEFTPGATVTCTLQVEDQEVPFTVTYLGAQAETEGGGESYELRSAKPIVDIQAIVNDIREQASAQLGVAPHLLTVECGERKMQVLDVGGRIPCTVNDGKTTRRLAAVVTDATGSIAINEV